MKKALVLILALIISLFAAIGLTACNDVEFEVKFIVDGTVYDTITTAGNETIKIPENPTKEGYTFDGWYLDEGVWEKPFTANSLLDAPLSSDMNVYAHWLPVTGPAPDQGAQGDNNGGTTAPDTHTHSLTHHDRVEATTCTTDSTIEYWSCSDCGKNYSDANAENEVSSVVIPAGHAASASTTVCTRCGLVSFDGLKFSLLSDGTYAVTDYTGSAASVVIPTTYENALVTSIGESAFSGCASLKSITIPNSVNSIGDDAFEGCTSLNFNTYDNAYYLGNNENQYLFLVKARDTSITSCTINSNTRFIHSFAFRLCSSLTSITIPNSVTSIGEEAFRGCSSLTSVTFAEGSQLTSIGERAFYSCSSLSSITIPNSVTSIGSWAFNGCSSLTSITIPNSVTSIGACAFYECSSLKSINIPNSVTSIGEDAFCNCSSLNFNTYDNAYYLGNNENPYLVLVKAKDTSITSITSCTINSNTRFIHSFAFLGCSSLTSITIPNSVTSIGEEAFRGCSSLTSVTFAEGNQLTSIGYWAFEGCESLEEITIPNSVTSIGDHAFYDCSSLTSVTIGSGVTSIGRSAFQNCTALTEINFNATAMNDLSSKSDAFTSVGRSGSGIKVTIGKNVTKIPAYLFCPWSSGNFYAPKITSVEFEEGSVCASIGSSAFEECRSLTSINIPNSVTAIGDGAFEYCSSLDKVYISDIARWCAISFGSRDANPLYYAKKLYMVGSVTPITNLIIPEGVTSIGNYAFEYCSSFTSITIPNSVTSIGSLAFSDCDSLTSITIPNSVTSIGSSTFSGCNSLESITIPNSVTSIGGGAFGDCTSLTSITIPNGVTSIGGSTFSGCSLLKSITIPNDITSIGSDAFYECTSLTNITIPNSVTSIGERAFSLCSSLNFNTYDNAYYLGNNENPYLVLVKAKDTSITSCTINSNTRFIHSSAFDGCSSLEEIIIPNSVTSIGDSAFRDCTSLTSVTIPNSVTSIGYGVFEDCKSLTSITIPNSVKSIDTSAFERCSSLTSITIPNSVTSIGSGAFEDCKSLTSITIPNSVKSIDTSAFERCSSLTSITIPNSVTSIGGSAFGDCTALTEINFNATAMNDLHDGCEVFYNAGRSGSGIKVTIGKNVTKIPANLFYFYYYDNVSYPPKITSVEFEEGSVCASIGSGAFERCSSLKNINIPNSVTSIGELAFMDCSSLKSITIPNSVTSIGDGAFNDCDLLTSVIFANTSGWWYSSSNTATSGTSISSTGLENTSTAATYLKSTYSNYYWKRG